jgi:hypothetical protein
MAQLPSTCSLWRLLFLFSPPQMSNRVSQQDYAKRVQVRGIVRHSSVQNEVSIQVRRFVGEMVKSALSYITSITTST